MSPMDERVFDQFEKHFGKTRVCKNLKAVNLPFNHHALLIDCGRCLADLLIDIVPSGFACPYTLVVLREPYLFLDHAGDIDNLFEIAGDNRIGH